MMSPFIQFLHSLCRRACQRWFYMAYDFPLSLMIRGNVEKLHIQKEKSDNIVKIKENMTRNKEMNVMKRRKNNIDFQVR